MTKIKIAYCKNCNAEYNLIEAYGEKCLSCGSDLSIAEKIIDKEYSCIKII